MKNQLPRALSRRLLLRSLLFGAMLPVAGTARAAPGAWLATSPTDDIGPFYPSDWSGEIDANLASFGGASAEGRRLRIQGYLKDATGQPLRDAAVEIWHADARGLYRHPAISEARRDPGFQGYGRTYSDDDGGYAFLTVMPGRYGTRPPHVHFRVAPPGRPDFVTQMYFRGDNREGGTAGRGILPPGRAALSVQLKADGIGSLVVRFDLVLPAA